MLHTPILFLIFNRLDTTQKVFEKIREVKPMQLYIAADGARKNKDGEDKICEEVKHWVLQQIDWDCNVITRFQEENQGCGKHVSGAITWFFEHVEEGIILEDDCIPDLTFFNFCAELLEKFRNNEQIFVISGSSFINYSNSKYSYFFSAYGHIWGWATWKRAWRHYNYSIKNINENTIKNQLKKYFKDEEQKYWLEIFYLMKYNPIDTWDYQWSFCQWINNGLNIIPSKNLVSNIGFDENATHTTNVINKVSFNKIHSIPNICHQTKLKQNKINDSKIFKIVFKAPNFKKEFFIKTLYNYLKRIILQMLIFIKIR